jgi:hypothetical protein
VETLGHLLALHVTPANKQERKQAGFHVLALPFSCSNASCRSPSQVHDTLYRSRFFSLIWDYQRCIKGR